MIPELTKLSEALTQKRRDRILQPIEKRMARDVAVWFRDLGKGVVKSLRPLASRFDQSAALMQEAKRPLLRESISFSEWASLVTLLLNDVSVDLEETIETFSMTALVTGADTLIKDLKSKAVFAVTDPRAIAYAQGRAAAQVTRINQTTMKQLNTVIVNALNEGWGWTRTADAIVDRFNDFAGPPLFPSRKFRSRAQMIAAFEIGDAYEAGNQIMAEEFISSGTNLEKIWLTAGDDRVRPEHRNNNGAGYIPFTSDFPSGDDRPPTDPGCRCTVAFRVKR